MRFLFAFFLFMAGCFNIVTGQNRYKVLAYNTENGLPSNGIKGVCFDNSSGYLWIGTEAGIVRFNGSRFEVFNNQNTPQILNNRISFIEKTNDGLIYACDLALRWFIIKENRIHILNNFSKNELDNDSIYLSLFYKTPQLTHVLHKVYQNTRIYNELFKLKNAQFLLRYNYNRLGIVTTEKNEFECIDSNIRSVFHLNQQYYVWNQKGICRFETSSKTFTLVPLYNETGKEVTLNEGYELISGANKQPNYLLKENRLWKIVENRGRLSLEALCDRLPKQTKINFIDTDPRNDILFIGTDSKGLLVLKPIQVETKKPIETLKTFRNSQYSQLIIDSNTILTNYGVLFGKNVSFHNMPILPGETFFKNTFSFRDSILLYIKPTPDNSYPSSLHLYHYKTKETKVYNRFYVNEDFSAYLQDDTLFLCTDKGFGFIDHDTVRYLFYNPELPNVSFKSYAMEQIKPGVFWVASSLGLLEYNIYNNTSVNRLYFPGIFVRSIQRIGNDFLIGTYGKGFYMYRNKTLAELPRDKNDYLAFAHCFMSDKLGFIWISTNRGLFKVKHSDLQEAFDKKVSSVYYHYFGQDDGMDMTEMNGGCTPCAVHLNAETISFPTMDGLLWVKPGETNKLMPGGNIYIENIIADGKTYSPDSLSTIKLPTHTQNIEVDIDFLAWCNEENIYVEYSLNENKTWKLINTQTKPYISFQNLSGGDYTLHLRKRNGFGLYNYNYKSISFRIGTPFYFQVWFVVLSLLLFYTSILGFIRWRTNNLRIKQISLEKQIHEKTKSLKEQNLILEKNNQINNRLISIISHDIITPLKFMSMGSKRLLDKNRPMPPELQEETITEITHTAQELQSLTTNILNWIKYQHQNRRQQSEVFSPVDIINEVFKILSIIASQKDIQLINRANTSLQCTQFREPIKILLYNLINNAIQFSSKNNIVVEAFSESSELCLRVIDRGSGMSQEQVNNILSDDIIITSVNQENKKGNGLGYLIIKDLLKIVHGKLSIESEKNKGTVVSITMPLHLSSNH